MARNKYLLTRDGYRLSLHVDHRSGDESLISLTMVCIDSGTAFTVVPAMPMHLDRFNLFQWIRDAGIPLFNLCRRYQRPLHRVPRS